MSIQTYNEMKRFVLAAASAALAAVAFADQQVITLDLSRATTPLEFDAQTGAWTGTYDDEATVIESQCFNFVHSSISDWRTWWGFTASNSSDRAPRDNYITYQFSGMPCGGILLDEEGEIMRNAQGAPLTGAGMPYLVAFYSPYMAERPVDVTFAEGKSYEAVGAYVSLNSYTYYAVTDGDSFARAFTDGDRFTLTVHGIGAADGSDRSVDVTLASYDNGCLTTSRGWQYVDLSQLGEVSEIYFTLRSTDTGDYGDNTPAYFCLDKLTVRDTGSSALTSARGPETLKYDRATATVTTGEAGYASVYDAIGRKVLSSEEPSFSIASLAAGVYVVRVGNASLKIAR